MITRIVSLSMLTNWLGYMLLAGFLFLLHPLQLPPSWKMGNHGLQWLGAGLILVAVGLPGGLRALRRAGLEGARATSCTCRRWRMAVLQLAMSCVNWSLMAGVVYVLLQQKVAYTDVLTVLLIGAVAGVVAHVPAGLGVFEFVFVALLSHQVSEGRLIGALLGYRAIYYIVPLIVAALLYLVMEVHARKHRHLRKRYGTAMASVRTGTKGKLRWKRSWPAKPTSRASAKKRACCWRQQVPPEAVHWQHRAGAEQRHVRRPGRCPAQAGRATCPRRPRRSCPPRSCGCARWSCCTTTPSASPCCTGCSGGWCTSRACATIRSIPTCCRPTRWPRRCGATCTR